MRINAQRWHRFGARAGMVGVALATLAAFSPQLAAQDGPADARWNAFVGCWSPIGAPGDATASLLCVVPAAGTSAVDLVTVADGKVVSREHVDASGVAANDTRDQCTGWQRAEWARDGERVYLHAEYTCRGGLHQVTSSLLGLTADGDLLDVQGLNAGRNKGVRVAQYRQAPDSSALPADIAAAIGARTMAVDAARVAASAPISTAAVIEASHAVDPLVVEAWLTNHGDAIAVDGADLVAMANAGVPGDVTDVLVALSNPQKFTLNPALTGEPAQYTSASTLRGVVGARVDSMPTRRNVDVCGYSVYWMPGSCYYSPWDAYGYGYGAYGGYWPYPGYYGYGSAWGWSPYAPVYSGYGWAGGGWYTGAPVVVVTQPSGNSRDSHGRVVKGQGYVSGRPAGGGSAGGSTNAASGSSGSSAGQGAAASPPRTAHKRGSGGGGGR